MNHTARGNALYVNVRRRRRKGSIWRSECFCEREIGVRWKQQQQEPRALRGSDERLICGAKRSRSVGEPTGEPTSGIFLACVACVCVVLEDSLNKLVN